MPQDTTTPNPESKIFDKAKPAEISQSAVEMILRSNPAASAYKVGISNVWVWIHGAIVSKRGVRRRVLEAFLDAPHHRLTSADLAPIANQYTPRIGELRDAGFPIPNLPTGDGKTYYELLVTKEQEREIRAALAVADVLKLKPQRQKATTEPTKANTPALPPVNSAGQFGFGFTPSATGFLDSERGVRE